MSVSPSAPRFKYPERPGPCRTCGAPAWWNGVRRVAQVVRDACGAVLHITDAVRRRARCSDPTCEAADWTVYEEGGYPHRVFALPVVAAAVAEVAFTRGTTPAAVAARHHCSRRSVWRWSAWVARLAEPATLTRACARIEPDGVPPPAAPKGAPEGARAGHILRLLDVLAGCLRARGVRLPSPRCGLAALLGHQLARFGDIAYLTRPSPPLRTPRASDLV